MITNDDGIEAPGLRALHSALRDLADVIVAAPAKEWSTRGHNSPTREPIAVEGRDDPDMGRVIVIHAPPADCTRLALTQLVQPRPDVLISGINRGGNSGVDVYYSGTVAAAREAVILGCPAIAISQLVRREFPVDWASVTARARVVLQHMLAELPPDTSPRLWNVNLPHLPPGQRPKGAIKVPMATTPLEIVYERTDAPPSSPANTHAVYRYTGYYFRRPAPPHTDVAYLFNDWVTITELTTDTTNPQSHHAEMPWP